MCHVRSGTIAVQESGERGGSFVTRVVEPGVGPVGPERLDETLGLAVGARRVRPRAQMPDPQALAGRREVEGAIAVAVVGEHPADAHTRACERCRRAFERGDRRRGALVAQDRDLWPAAVIVDRDVAVLVAGYAAPGVVGDPSQGAPAPARLDVCEALH